MTINNGYCKEVTMPIDIDRLHAVIQGKVHGRRCGKTFARVCELAAEVQLSDCIHIVVLITHYNDISYLWPMIKEVFDELGIQCYFYRHRHEITGNNKVIHFVSYFDLNSERLRGLDYYTVRMGHYD